MKKLSGNSFKTVDYFGVMLAVGDNIRYLATTKDGDVIAFDQKPARHMELGWLSACESFIVSIAKVDLEGMDWKDTLMEVE